MKSALSYVCSLIISVLLVLTSICAEASLVANINIKEGKFHSLAYENDLSGKTLTQLNKYFSSRYNSTGVPAEVYMDAIDETYIDRVINEYIDCGFNSLRTGGDVVVNVENDRLEKSIEDFFVESAENSGKKQDEKFEKKLEETKKSAYSVISEYCDTYKFTSLKKHGVLQKLTLLFNRLDMIVIVSVAACMILMLLLFLLNIRFKPATLYWIGVSSFIAGIISAVPSLYLLASGYFDRFTIKQAQVYAAYTSAMKLYTNSLLAASICIVAAGICFFIVYRTITKHGNKTAKEAK